MSYKKLLKQIDLKQTRLGIANNNNDNKISNTTTRRSINFYINI